MKRGKNIVLILTKTSCKPRDTKNIVAKKSFNELIRAIILRLYGRFASVIPPRNAPIAMEKSRRYAPREKRKHTATDKRKSSSLDFAANLNKECTIKRFKT